MPIDLHTHSTASDGALTPTELVTLAKQRGLDALALTDHDTVDGLEEALAAGREVGIEVVPGCELSVETDQGNLHILALFLPSRPEKLQREMDDLVRYRHDRNRIIVDKLRELNVDITYDEVRQVAGDGPVGRPHIARVLLDRGYVTSFQQAFDRYIGDNGKAYAPKRVMTAARGIPLLKEEGATVILAHPFQLGMGTEELEDLVLQLKALGLDGIEAYYTEHSPSKTRRYLALANRMGLVVSGGSDFHGPAKPNTRLGTGKGDLHVPVSVLDDLKAHRRAHGLPV
ncbi:MAG: PHP domain-containing protein [Desulfovibrionaceae bacterium]